MSNNIHINYFALLKGWQNMFNGSNITVTKYIFFVIYIMYELLGNPTT